MFENPNKLAIVILLRPHLMTKKASDHIRFKNGRWHFITAIFTGLCINIVSRTDCFFCAICGAFSKKSCTL